MKKIEVKNQESGKSNIEDVVIEKILSSKEINLEDAPSKDIKTFIRNKIVEANYLDEEWKINYAIERIFEEIKMKIKPEEKIKEKKEKKKEFYSLLLALCFYFFFQITFGAIGLLFFFIAFIPINMLIHNKRARNIIINLAVSAVISPFIAYGLFSNFNSTENLNPLLSIMVLVAVFIFLELSRFVYKKLKR